MTRPKFRISNIVFYIVLILADLFIYVVLGMLFMGYEDFYDESEGPWMSLQSMTPKEKIIYYSINVWYIANILLLIWLTFKIIKWFMRNRTTKSNL